MMLTGLEIKKRLESDIFIEPFNEAQLNPNSYNLKLHNELLIYYDDQEEATVGITTLDMKKNNPTKKIIIPETGYKMRPGILYLGRTVEYTKTYNLVAGLDGRSSIGRLGINIHATAGFGDIGFEGYWTLELSCIQPVIIYPNVEICQIYYHDIIGDFIPYHSNKYQRNHDVQPSMLYKDFEKKRSELINGLYTISKDGV